jgi:hypothetical protein
MSLVRIDHQSETSAYAWLLECDSCHHRDSDRHPGRYSPSTPVLYRYHLRGWYIARVNGDRCPNCVAAGKHRLRPGARGDVAGPMFTAECLDRMRAAVGRDDEQSRRLLAGLTPDEIATLTAGPVAAR